jgi:positive regulator of sigma E activity
MFEKARVLQRKEDKAIVVFESKEACSHCASRNICHLAKEGLRQMEVEDEIGTEVGDLVEVSIPNQGIIKRSFLLYILPTIFFVGGMAFSLFKRLSELISLGVGFFSLSVAFFIIFLIDKNYSRKKDSQPKIIKKLKTE